MSQQALLLSIRPRFAQLIFAGTKRVELRRVRPKIGPGDLVFIYASSPTKAVQGAFEVKRVLTAPPTSLWRRFGRVSGLAKTEFDDYFNGRAIGCAILIGRCWQLRKAVRLEQLRGRAVKFRPPQSFHYKCPREFSRSIGFSPGKRLELRLAGQTGEPRSRVANSTPT